MDGFQSAATPVLGAFLSLTEMVPYGRFQTALDAGSSEVQQTISNVAREIHQNSSATLETNGSGLTHQTGEHLLLPPPSANLAGCRVKQSTEKRPSIPSGMTSDASRLLASCDSLSISLAEAARLASTQSLIVATANTSMGNDKAQLSLPTTLWLPNRGLRLDYQIHSGGGLHLNPDFGISRR